MTDHSSCFLQVGTHSAYQAFLILSGLPASLLLFLQRRKLRFLVSCHIAEWRSLRSEVVCRCQSPPTGQRHGSQKMVREDKRRNSFIWADLLREKNVPGPHRLAKQERRHNGGKWRAWQALGGSGLERDMPANSTHNPQPTLFFTPKASRGGVGLGEVSSVLRGTSCKSQEGQSQEESPEGGAVQ